MVFPHRIFVEWSEAKGCFVAHVSVMPGAPGYGATPEAAVRELFGAESVVVEASPSAATLGQRK